MNCPKCGEKSTFTMYEIFGTDGKVHYRRPWGHRDLDGIAMGYSVVLCHPTHPAVMLPVILSSELEKSWELLLRAYANTPRGAAWTEEARTWLIANRPRCNCDSGRYGAEPEPDYVCPRHRHLERNSWLVFMELATMAPGEKVEIKDKVVEL